LLGKEAYKAHLREHDALSSYIDYIKLSDKVRHLELFDELELLNEKIASAFFKNETQKRVYIFSKSVSLLKDLYNLELTPKKLEYMKKNPAAFDIQLITSFVKNTADSFGVSHSLNTSRADSQANQIKKAQEFYKVAIERDRALVNNTLKRLPFSSNKAAVLIAGGFHTSGITNVLKEKDISYVVICPTVGIQDTDRLYADRMQGILPDYKSFLEMAFQTLQLALTTGDTKNLGQKRGIRSRYELGYFGLEVDEFTGRDLYASDDEIESFRQSVRRYMGSDNIIYNQDRQAYIDGSLRIMVRTGEIEGDEIFYFTQEDGYSVIIIDPAGFGNLGPLIMERVLRMVMTHEVAVQLYRLAEEEPGTGLRAHTAAMEIEGFLLSDMIEELQEEVQQNTILLSKVRSRNAVNKLVEAIHTLWEEREIEQSAFGPLDIRGHAAQELLQHRASEKEEVAKKRRVIAAMSIAMVAAVAMIIIGVRQQGSAYEPSSPTRWEFFKDILSRFSHEAPAITNARQRLQPTQIGNFIDMHDSIDSVVFWIFQDQGGYQMAKCRLLLRGTVATESYFLDTYKGRTEYGSGHGQITRNTIKSIFSNWITYPLKIGGWATNNELYSKFKAPILFATGRKHTLDEMIKLSRTNTGRRKIQQLCIENDDFANLIIIMTYYEKFYRFDKGKISNLPSGAEGLAELYVEYYNPRVPKDPKDPESVKKAAQERQALKERFVKRFNEIHPSLFNGLVNLANQLNAKHVSFYSDAPEIAREAKPGELRDAAMLSFSSSTIDYLQSEYGISELNIVSMLASRTPKPYKGPNTYRWSIAEEVEDKGITRKVETGVHLIWTPKGTYLLMDRDPEDDLEGPSIWIDDFEPLVKEVEKLLPEDAKPEAEQKQGRPAVRTSSAGTIEAMERRCSDLIYDLYRNRMMQRDTAFRLNRVPFGLLVSADIIRIEDIEMLNMLADTWRSVKRTAEEEGNSKFIIYIDATDSQLVVLREEGLSRNIKPISGIEGISGTKEDRLLYAAQNISSQSICTAMLLNHDTAEGFKGQEEALRRNKIFIRAQEPEDIMIGSILHRDMISFKVMLLHTLGIFHRYGSDSRYRLADIIDILDPISVFTESVERLKAIHEEVLRAA
ncbi:MAG: hypothetical protein HQ572_03740, partial [Candidatus Omnitrophica bacterium]|nr:hypothetical protein [Candidatus Omnitrophota bacterium]